MYSVVKYQKLSTFYRKLHFRLYKTLAESTVLRTEQLTNRHRRLASKY
jgi:hypothetical protein